MRGSQEEEAQVRCRLGEGTGPRGPADGEAPLRLRRDAFSYLLTRERQVKAPLGWGGGDAQLGVNLALPCVSMSRQSGIGSSNDAKEADSSDEENYFCFGRDSDDDYVFGVDGRGCQEEAVQDWAE